MSRSEKRRRIRRLLAGALVGAAVLVPAAPAMPTSDVGDESTSSTVIPYLSQGQATVPVLADQVQSTDERAFVRAEGRPDGAVIREPVLRREAPDGYMPQRYTTSAQQADDGGSGFDWTATGIGAGSAALLLAFAAGGALILSRHRHDGAAHA